MTSSYDWEDDAKRSWALGVACQREKWMQDQIMRELRQSNALTAEELSHRLCTSPSAIQAALIEMDDAGKVTMRNGFYRAAVKES